MAWVIKKSFRCYWVVIVCFETINDKDWQGMTIIDSLQQAQEEGEPTMIKTQTT